MATPKYIYVSGGSMRFEPYPGYEPYVLVEGQAQESPAGSALVAEVNDALERWFQIKENDEALISHAVKLGNLLQRARDRIVELESSGDVVEISTLLALKSQFTAQQERIADLEAQLAAPQEKQRYIFEQLSQIVPDDDDNRPLEKVARLAVERYAAAQADARRIDWIERNAGVCVWYPVRGERTQFWLTNAKHTLRDEIDAAVNRAALASPSGEKT